ncbi:MAG: tail completion protein gp17 [Terriglobales bacterium]
MIADLFAYITGTPDPSLDAGRIAALQAIQALIATRFYPEILDEGCAMPAAVYQLISSRTDHQLDGTPDNLFTQRLQVDVYAQGGTSDYAICKSLADNFRIALDGLAQLQIGGSYVNVVTYEDERDEYESERRQYRRSLDFEVVYQ